MTKLGKRPLGAQRSARFGWLAALLLAIVLGALLWGGLRRGPAPSIQLTTQFPAIGRSNRVVARFAEPLVGLGTVRLELVQGDHSVVLAEQRFDRPGSYRPFAHGAGAETELQATVGSDKQPWLAEGEAVLRASADRMHGPLRRSAPVVVERTLAVRLHPPTLAVISHHHYVRQGGSGVVVLRPGEGAVASGVRAGDEEFASYPMPGSATGERFVLYGVPWNLDDSAQVRAFAVDDAGNRTEVPFLDAFRRAPPSHDTITVDDAFLERVVPAIASQTPDLPSDGDLLQRYLVINGDLRRADLEAIRSIGRGSREGFLAGGPFEQLPSSARRAGFADERTYVYAGKVVDHQTHLGLDLASTAGAAVPAGNGGRVVHAGWLGIYGNAVILDHGYGLMSLYGHLSAVEVGVGDVVTKGQTLGRTGATGLAGGDHLHFEVFLQGWSVDPMEWLDAHWIRDNVASKIPYPM